MNSLKILSKLSESASPFIRGWYRNTIVLACTSYMVEFEKGTAKQNGINTESERRKYLLS